MKIKNVVITILLTVFLSSNTVMPVSANSDFPDVKKSHWFADDINDLKDMGIINGYTDGTFRPGNNVSRVEAMKIIWSSIEHINLDIDNVKGNNSFTDIDSYKWYGDTVNNMYKAGVIDGYVDGTFKPNKPITRAEIAKVIAKAYNIPKSNRNNPFVDIPQNIWYKDYVSNLFNAGIAKGSNGKYMPLDNVSRAEVSSLTIRAMDWHEGKEMPEYTPPSKPIVDNKIHPKYPNTYTYMREALENSHFTGYFDTSEMNHNEAAVFIQEVYSDIPHGTFVKSWQAYSNGEVRLLYLKSPEVIQSKKKQVNQRVDSILKDIIKPKYNDYQKVKAVHDYIVLNTAYDYDNYIKGTTPKVSHTAYGALFNGIAVCDGYTKAAELMLNKLGIENKYVIGDIKSTNGLHSWNMVKLDGKYYHMDTTWDDPVPNVPNRVIYDYFLVDSKAMDKTRTWIKSNYPKANNGYYKQ